MSLLLYAHDRDRIQYVEVAPFVRRLATAEAARIGPPLRCMSTRWAAPVLTRRERRGCKPIPGFVLSPGKRRHQSDSHLVKHVVRYVTPLRLILFMTNNSDYIMLYGTNPGLDL